MACEDFDSPFLADNPSPPSEAELALASLEDAAPSWPPELEARASTLIDQVARYKTTAQTLFDQAFDGTHSEQEKEELLRQAEQQNNYASVSQNQLDNLIHTYDRRQAMNRILSKGPFKIFFNGFRQLGGDDSPTQANAA